MKRVARYAVAVGGVAGWFGFNAVMGFYTYLWRNSPDVADFATGRIAPMYQQSRIFFVEPWERWLAFYGLTLSLGLVALAGIIGGLYFRREIALKGDLSWLNGCAIASFLVWFAYAAWPLSR